MLGYFCTCGQAVCVCVCVVRRSVCACVRVCVCVCGQAVCTSAEILRAKSSDWTDHCLMRKAAISFRDEVDECDACVCVCVCVCLY